MNAKIPPSRRSRLLLLVAANLFLLMNARATLYLTEPFDYPAEPLTNAPAWSPTNGTGTVVELTPTLLLISGDLAYGTLTDPAPVNHTRMQFSNNVKGCRPINGPIGTVGSGSSVYCSFIFYKATTNGTTASSPIIGVSASGTATINQAGCDGMVLYHQQSGVPGSGTYHLGIKVGGGATAPAYPTGTQIYTSGNTNTTDIGQTNFIVMKYTFNAGAGNDTVALWVNPDPSSFGLSEPAATTNDVAATPASAFTSATESSSGLQFFQTRGGASAASGTIQLDNIRVGDTWADVTPTCITAGIGTPPADQAVSPGQTATFSIVATGVNPTYQWQTNNGGGWIAITGATGSNYTTAPEVLTDNGLQFRCVVSVACDGSSTNSPAATLTVQTCVAAGVSDPTPISPTVSVGDTQTFSVTASGTSVKYQWQKSLNSGVSWSPISNATNSSYTTPPEVLSDNGAEFRCVVTVACGGGSSATSGAATLTVVCNTAGVTNPQNQTIVAGQTATFTVSGSGTHVTYQWATNNGSGWINIPHATNASYTTPPETVDNYGLQFQCTVSVACDSSAVTSAAASLIVNCDPATTTDPVSQSVAVGQTATFSVTGGGSLPTYQWQTNNGGGWGNISGATNSSYTTPPEVMGDNNLQFRCNVSACGPTTATSAAATLSVFPANAFFQSINSGNLNDPNTWEVSYDGGTTWTNPATYTPNDGNSTNVVIQSGHTVTSTANSRQHHVIVQSSGQVTVNASTTLTITNSPGNALDVKGTIDASGTLLITTNANAIVESGGLIESEQGGAVTDNGTLTFQSGATFQDNHTTGVSPIPLATWNTGSTCLIAGYTSDTTTLAGLTGQTFYNLTWNCPSQTAALPFGGNVPAAVLGDFTVVSTGSGEIRLSQNNSPVWNIAGNLNVLGGKLTLAAGTGKPVVNASNTVYIASGATLSNSLTSAGATIHFAKAGTQMFTNSGSIVGTVNWVVDNGSTLAGSGTLSSNLTIASGAQIRLTTNPALFGVANNLTGSNGTVVVDVGGGNLSAGTYTVMNYGGVFSGGLNAAIVDGTVSGTAIIDGVGAPHNLNLAVIGAQPRVATFSLSGTTLTISGSNGTPGVSCGVFSSTNLALPLSQWTPVVQGGVFDGSGNFSTNFTAGTNGQQFLIIRSPSP
jgi:hypothetical protein